MLEQLDVKKADISELRNLTNSDLKKLSREERGYVISKVVRIEKTDRGWKVPSQTGGGFYYVRFNGHNPKCDCPDCRLTKQKCKHIYAVEFYIKQEIDEEGKITQTKGVKVTYSQKWKAYDNAQTNERLFFIRLLSDLCSSIEQPDYEFGRPKIPLQDMVFCSAMKVYSTFSLRRFMSDIKIAKEMGYLDKVPCFASIGHFFKKEELTPILKELIKLSATPLASVEKDFTIDSSGFSTSRFARYFDYKWGKQTKYRIWMKAHLLSGVKTNIVAGVEITEGHSNDSPQLAPLMRGVKERFDIKEVSCDRAYSSRENLKLIEDEGALPFIPFKKSVTGKRVKYPVWRKMYHYFLYKHEDFMEHYHKRSNAETVFHMIKTKFRDNLRSKDKTSQVNELLIKVLCHNICVVIQEINELGIKGEFVMEKVE